MSLVFRWKIFEHDSMQFPDDVRFIHTPRGALAEHTWQSVLDLRRDGDACNRMARQMLKPKTEDAFRHLMHMFFRAGWDFGKGTRRAQATEYYIHVYSVRSIVGEEFLEKDAVILTEESGTKIEDGIRQNPAYEKTPIDITLETYGIVFSVSETGRGNFALLQRLLNHTSGTMKRAAYTLFASAFEAGMQGYANLTLATTHA